MNSNQSSSSLEVLALLHDQVDRRIAAVNAELIVLNTNKRRLEHALELFNDLKYEPNACDDDNGDSHSSNDEEENDQFKHLDSILSLAKEIRTQKNTKLKSTVQSERSIISEEPERPPPKAATYKQKSTSTKARRSTSLRQFVQRQQVAPENSKIKSSSEVLGSSSNYEEVWNMFSNYASQLQLMKRAYARQCPHSKIAITAAALNHILHSGSFREAYCAQVHFLSKLYNRPAIPRSVLYRVVMSQTENTVVTASSMPHQQNVLVRLRDAFKTLIGSYERFLKLRVDKIKSGNLSPQDKVDIISLWYRGQRLMGLYEHYMKKKRHIRCYCEFCHRKWKHSVVSNDMKAACAHLIVPCPKMTPLNGLQQLNAAKNANHVAQRKKSEEYARKLRSEQEMAEHLHAMRISKIKRPPFRVDNGEESEEIQSEMSSSVGISTIDSGMSNQDVSKLWMEWSQQSEQRVKEFHHTFQTRVKFVAESAIGQSDLRDSIKALKQCCELQAQHLPPPPSSSQSTPLSRPPNGEIGYREREVQLPLRWIEALRNYRLIYSMLVTEAHDTNNCFFLHKKN